MAKETLTSDPYILHKEKNAKLVITIGICNLISGLGILVLPEPLLKALAVTNVIIGCGLIIDGIHDLGYAHASKDNARSIRRTLPATNDQTDYKSIHNTAA